MNAQTNPELVRNRITILAIVCAFASALTCPIVVFWLCWVSSSIVSLREEQAFLRGEKERRVTFLVPPKIRLGVNTDMYAEMELPIEKLLKHLGVLK